MRHPALEPKQRVEFIEENDPDSGARQALLRGGVSGGPWLLCSPIAGVQLSSSADTTPLLIT